MKIKIIIVLISILSIVTGAYLYLKNIKATATTKPPLATAKKAIRNIVNATPKVKADIVSRIAKSLPVVPTGTIKPKSPLFVVHSSKPHLGINANTVLSRKKIAIR